MNNDLISRSEAEKLGATCLARRNENGQLEAVISLDHAPTVEIEELKPLINKVVEIIPELSDAIIENLPKLINKSIKCSECPFYIRPHGEWIIVRDKKWGDNVKCPFCGKELAGTDLNFCCKCGAKLIGSEKMNGGADE